MLVPVPACVRMHRHAQEDISSEPNCHFVCAGAIRGAIALTGREEQPEPQGWQLCPS